MELLINGIETAEMNETAEPSFGKLIETMERAAEICIRREGIDPQMLEISLSFVSPEEIHELNREHRGVDRVTDVLSFPMVEDLNELPGLAQEGSEMETAEDRMIPLGDVVICLDQAEAQAKEYGHSREREIVYLFVHSMLHLLGYDHMEPEEQKLMRTREEAVMQEVDLLREA